MLRFRALPSALLLAVTLSSGAGAPSPERPLVRWSFWVPAQRMAEFAPVFDARIGPLLAKHGFVDPQPDARAVPDSLFNRVYAVPSRSAFAARRDSVEADPAWLELMRELGQRFGMLAADGRLRRMVAPYRDPAGPGTRRHAPPGRVAPVGPGRGHWTTYGVPDGLPGLDVRHLFEDRDGNIWVSTYGSGVSRWDGERFATFTPQNGLAGLQPRFAMQDRAGNIWIALVDGGLSRFDGERMVSFGAQDGVPARPTGAHTLRQIIEDRRGNLWMPTVEGLLRYDGERFHTYDAGFELAFSTRSIGIREDRTGRLWVCTTEGVKRWDGREPPRFDPIGPPRNGEFVLEDRQGRIWIAGDSSVVRYVGDRWERLTDQGGPLADAAFDGPFGGLLEDRRGHVWVLSWGSGAYRWDGEGWSAFGAGEGLHSFNAPNPSVLEDPDGSLWFPGSNLRRWDGSRFATYTTADGLDQVNIMSALLDRRGDLWLGTLGNLSRFDPRRFVTYLREHGAADEFGGGAMGDRTGNLWLMSSEGVIRYDGATFSTWKWDDGPFHESCNALQDGEGAMWFTGNGAIYRLQADTLTTFSSGDGLVPGFHFGLAQDASGALWISSGSGVSRYDGQTFQHFTVQDGLPPSWVQNLWSDPEGRLWLGPWGLPGVTVYDGEGFTPFGVDEGLPPDMTRALCVDREGDLWFGSEGYGVSRWDGRAMVHYTTKDGLAHDAIRAIYQSQDGHLWFGSDGGVVSRFDGRVFQTLSRDDGLNGQSIRSIAQDGAGDIWFGTFQGAIRYRQPEASPPRVFVDAVVADRRHAEPARVTIPSTADLVAFEFHGRSLTTPPGNLVYLYRLRGHETEWLRTRARRVEYPNLPPGAYAFEIQAVDRDLVYSDTAALALDVYYQPALGAVAIDSLRFDDLFASFHRDYEKRPLGAVQVTNNDPDTVAATLHFQLGEWMRRPVEQPLTLAPGESRWVALSAALDPAILEVKETVTVPADVALSVAAGDHAISFERPADVTVLGRGLLRWDGVAPAAAFVSTADPSVADFAHVSLRAFDAEIRAFGQPATNLMKALVLFEALAAHGVRYQADASQPYAESHAAGAVDHIQYPAETLQSRAGDCDDLTVLYAALLESAGVATALVDYPEHIFLLVDTGLARWEAYRLPVEPRLGVVHGDRLWVPVETTLLGRPFGEAWRAGAEEVAKLSGVDLRRRVVPTAEAWTQYAPSAPALAPTPPPERESFAGAVEAGQRALEADVDAYVQRTYLDRLRDDPGDDALRTRLLRVYVALTRYDAAIAAGLDFLMDGAGDQPTAQNHLGIAYYLKGEVRQAAYYFRQALAARPDDDGIRRNLDQALWALGRAQEPGGVSAVSVAMGESPRGDAAQVDGDSFYWIE